MTEYVNPSTHSLACHFLLYNLTNSSSSTRRPKCIFHIFLTEMQIENTPHFNAKVSCMILISFQKKFGYCKALFSRGSFFGFLLKSVYRGFKFSRFHTMVYYFQFLWLAKIGFKIGLHKLNNIDTFRVHVSVKCSKGFCIKLKKIFVNDLNKHFIFKIRNYYSSDQLLYYTFTSFSKIN